VTTDTQRKSRGHNGTLYTVAAVFYCMASITREEVRRRILEILYKLTKEGSSVYGVYRSAVQEVLGLSERDMDEGMMYLERNNLVRLTEAPGVPWLWARITVLGKDAIENKERYAVRFPFMLRRT